MSQPDKKKSDPDKTEDRPLCLCVVGEDGTEHQTGPLPELFEIEIGRSEQGETSWKLYNRSESQYRLAISGDKEVSRQHCMVRRKGGRFTISDSSSRNGTWVHGIQIDADTEIPPGAPFTIGATKVTILPVARRSTPSLATTDASIVSGCFREVQSNKTKVWEVAFRDQTAEFHGMAGAAVYAELIRQSGEWVSNETLCGALVEPSHIGEAIDARALAVCKRALDKPGLNQEQQALLLKYVNEGKRRKALSDEGRKARQRIAQKLRRFRAALANKGLQELADYLEATVIADGGKRSFVPNRSQLTVKWTVSS